MMVANRDPCCLSLGPSAPLGGSLDPLSVIAVGGPALKLGLWKWKDFYAVVLESSRAVWP